MEGGKPLSEWLLEDEKRGGKQCYDEFGLVLPFLMKVLSVGQPLSIQAHPDKELAERLNSRKPGMYKDANHKPEMAIAVTNFSLLSGLASPDAVSEHLGKHPELKAIVGESTAEKVGRERSQESVMEAFQALAARMARDREFATEKARELEQRLRKASTSELGDDDRTALQISEHFSGDGGVFGAYLLRRVELSPGQAIFQPVNEPHTYLSGECIEVQASSDNVARAALTSKECDSETLSAMLARCEHSSVLLEPRQERPYVSVFEAPPRDFAVRIVSPPPGQTANIPPRPFPAVLLVRQGKCDAYLGEEGSDDNNSLSDSPAERLSPGSAVVIPARHPVSLTARDGSSVEAYHATVGMTN